MTYVITSDAAPGYVDRAAWNDLVATSRKHSASRKLARMMLEAGSLDGPIDARSPDGALLWSHRSLVEFARYDTNEDPRPRMARWVADPRFVEG